MSHMALQGRGCAEWGSAARQFLDYVQGAWVNIGYFDPSSSFDRTTMALSRLSVNEELL